MQMKSMKGRLRPGDTVAIGLMLFALFLGAGNLIFPPVLGQQLERMFGLLQLDSL